MKNPVFVSMRGATPWRLGLALVALCAWSVLAAPLDVRPLERVTLQLKWTHAFQFAGYYAALEKGYYREAGLEVNIIEATPGVDPIRNVLAGQAQFGVGTSSLLLERNAGKPVVALAVIFQHSPYVLIARQESATQGIHDLIGKRVMLEPQSDELLAYLKAEGLPLNRITRVEHSYNVRDLIDGRVDAIAGYVTNQPYDLDRAHFHYQIHTPRSAGIDFYGDNLFTTEQELRAHPARVKAFRAASLRGWQYAMGHPEEIVDLILARYSQRHTRDYYLFEGRQMLPLLRPELIEIGYMYPGRWRHIADTYAGLGMMPPDFDLKGFLYDPQPPPRDLRWLYLFLGVTFVVLAIISALVVYVYRTNARLRREVAERQRAETALRESENQKEAILNGITTNIALVDQNLTILWANQAAARSVNRLPEELVGHSCHSFWGDPAKPCAECPTRKAFQTGRSEHKIVQTPDGRIWDEGGEPVFDPAGKVIAVVEIAQDITERKRAEDALRKSQAQYDNLVANIPVGVYIMRSTPAGAFAFDYVSPKVAEIFKVSVENFLSDPQVGFRPIHPDDLAVLVNLNRERFQHPQPFEWEGQAIIEGTTKWLRIASSPEPQSNGEVLWNGVVVDITEHKQAEEALRQEQEFSKSLLDSLPGIFYLYSYPEGRLVLWNKQHETLFGYEAREMKGRLATDWHVPESKNAVLKAMKTIMETGHGSMEDVLVAKDGRLIPFFLTGVKFEAQGHSYLMGIGLDITARKQAENALRESEQQLLNMQKLQSIGTLAGGIAHDFNNILMGVFANLSFAKDELAKDHPGYRSLEEAESSMSRAVRLTKQLLTFAKGGDPVKTEVSLGTLIEEVARFDLSGSPVKLVYQQADDLWRADVDKGQIQQVVSNLTLNARQAMPAGGHLYITLANANVPAMAVPGLRPGRYLKVTVRDEGIGIDPKHLDRIFDPYFTTKQSGNGLGLATTYSIINKHGGQISVESSLGQGTTFTFYLPASASPPSAEPEPSAATSPPLSRPARILVMDDEATVCGIVARMLTPCGFAVVTVSDGRKALEAYRQAMADGTPFDGVIMDLTVPGGLGGKDAITELLAMDPHAKAIVSSGYAEDPVMANYADYGFKGVVAKPYTKNDLREILARVLA